MATDEALDPRGLALDLDERAPRPVLHESSQLKVARESVDERAEADGPERSRSR